MWLPLKDIELSAKEVFVVAFAGSANDGFAPKSTVLNSLSQTCLFTPLTSQPGVDTKVLEQLRKHASTLIEAQYDTERNILYLALVSPFDALILNAECASLGQTRTTEAHHEQLEAFEQEHVKALFFLFAVSHVVVLIHPTPRVELRWLQVLRVLEQRKSEHAETAAAAGSVSDFDLLFAPHCMPALFFVFENDGVITQGDLAGAQQTLEAQLKRVFKALLLSPTTERTCRLFFLPSTDFVFFYTPVSALQLPATHLPADPTALLVETFFSSPLSLFPDTSPLAAFRAAAGPGEAAQAKGSVVEDARSGTDFLDAVRVRRESALARADKALVAEAEYANDEARLPTLAEWAAGATPLFTSLCLAPRSSDDSEDGGFAGALDALKAFSLSRCEAAFTQAMGEYTQGLPQYYPAHVHRKHVASALRLYANFASGPVFNTQHARLVAECEMFWASGRQSCEARSVTGRLCVQPRHGDETRHDTDFHLMCSCTCGVQQRSVPDPFSLDGINTFNIEEECCKNAILSWSAFPLESGDMKRQPVDGTRELFGGDSALASLLARSASLGESEDGAPPSPTAAAVPAAHAAMTEPRPCWKLYFMGHGKTYSPGTGLAGKAGFLPRTNFLLPWEVSVPEDWVVPRSSSSSSTPVSSAGSRVWSAEPRDAKQGGGSSASIGSSGKRDVQYSRGYIGYEYECLHGHRYIAGGPGKPVKISASGYIKGTASKILNASMPLVQPCPCNDGAMSQLTKLHIITPSSPHGFELLPRLQFVESPALVVHSGAGISLEPNCSYVLRLPRVFTQHGKPILLPTSQSALKQVVLLAHPLHVQ